MHIRQIRIRHRSLATLLCLMTTCVISPLTSQADEPPAPGDQQIIRVPLIHIDDLPGSLRGRVDTCATEIGETGLREAVLFVDSEELDLIEQLNLPHSKLGTLAEHAKRFLPLNTLREVGEIPSLTRLIGQQAMTKVLEEVGRSGQRSGLFNRTPPTLTYDRYHTLQEGITFLNDLAAEYPTIAQVVDIGDTIEGRDIWALKITDNPGSQEPEEELILFTGVTHAREWITHETILYMAEYLTSHYLSDLEVRSIIDRTEVWLVPAVNPDGFEYSWNVYRLWRKNLRDNSGDDCSHCSEPSLCEGDGVDINRNFSYKWGRDDLGSSGCPDHTTYRGLAPASEPETQAIESLVSQHKFAVAVSFHSYGQLVLYPWAYTENVIPESYSSLRAMGRKYADIVLGVHGETYIPGQGSYTIYLANGTMDDYAYGAEGSLAFTPELRPSSAAGGGFLLPEGEILPTCEENMPATLWLLRNVADVTELQNPASATLIESPTMQSINKFSLALTPTNQDPAFSLGFPTGFSDQLQAWMDDDDSSLPPGWRNLYAGFEGCGSGSGYRVDMGGTTLYYWAAALNSYWVLPYVFEDGSKVMLSNVEPGQNVIGIPTKESLFMQDISIIERTLLSTGTEIIQEERSALEDLNSPSPWIDWNWVYTDSWGNDIVSHPTGAGGASQYVEPFRAYTIQVNVPSYQYDDFFNPVYMLSFPSSFIFYDCNNNGVLDADDIAYGGSQDCQPNGIPDECEGGPWVYGDVDSNGDVNVSDLLCLLDGLASLFSCPDVTFEDLDIYPCGGGNSDVNLLDLLALLDALAGVPPCPDPCP